MDPCGSGIEMVEQQHMPESVRAGVRTPTPEPSPVALSGSALDYFELERTLGKEYPVKERTSVCSVELAQSNGHRFD